MLTDLRTAPREDTTLRCLWLTWTDPQPEHDGQRIYSGRLIDALAGAGAAVDVLCFASEGSRRRYGTVEGRVAWWPAPRASRPGWASLFSSLPNLAYRSESKALRQTIRQAAVERLWDAVVLDGLGAGWALPLLAPLRGPGGCRPQVVYVAHNHEESTRARVAVDYRGSPFVKTALRLDSFKVRRLEQRMVDRADLITAITPEDAERFIEGRPDKRIIVLPPGYAGQRIPRRLITADHPRRAVVVGSFDWVAKRMNLERFLTVADPLFGASKTELHVVGNGAPEFMEQLRRRFPATRFVGAVPAIEPHLAEARIAVVPELTGGGFKLKVLDYVFNRLPIAAIDGSVTGVPLRAPESLLSFKSLEDLACGVVAAIDDLPLLNRLQDRAFAACANQFEWQTRGEWLLTHTACP
ncbi:MAG: glycosyltransferase family 4 protein [Rhodospirillales bacterium]|jgi:glycosyltransferase involved in cell wall biosynthesis|nr:glycosyltransferase family 4 protein [Rhodospirillales bacterium]